MHETKDESAQRRSSFSCAVPLVIIDSFSRRSFSYNKLPQNPLKLTVLKLDSSSFEIEVSKTATVAELRKSVENAFSHLPKEGPGKISWSHVWGHFCLCFDGQKLLDDNDYIADYEIRDGDQLLFARHLSINYNLKRNISTDQIGDIEQPSISNTWEPEEVIDERIYESCDDETPRQKVEEHTFPDIPTFEYKMATILRGWFSYRRVSSSPEPNFNSKEIVKAPEKGPVFMEDLPEEEQVVVAGHSAGLFNLGNTCYMNSTLQCLHSVPELKSALIKYPHSGRSNDLDQPSHLLTVATRDLFSELDKSVKAVAPMQFWTVLRKKYPQFGQLHNGSFMQQDAEECWTQILYTLSQSLKTPNPSENLDAIKGLFGIELVSRVHCAESGEESSETESVHSLKCHISHEVNHLHEGLKHGLKSELEKSSPSLGRSAIYVKDSRINGLPRYLTVQFVRFFWKRESNQKAKILRKVDYPLELDIYDLCSDDLKKSLEVPRQILRDEEGKKLGLKSKEKSSSSSENDVKMSDAEGSSKQSGESSIDASQEGGVHDKEMQLTGVYDLVAVLTHKGRSADSGHYVAWVKQESGKWIQYDDDNPIPQREEDIVKLSGGGDWHMAYICMYKARVVPK